MLFGIHGIMGAGGTIKTSDTFRAGLVEENLMVYRAEIFAGIAGCAFIYSDFHLI